MAYNLFATDKQKNYPGAQVQTQQSAVDAESLMPKTAEQAAGVVNGANGTNVYKPVVQQPSVLPTPAIDPSDPSSGMNALSQMYTSPEQEEKMRKASVNNQRIMAVADALRHIGNIYNTVNYAPAQQFNSPVQEEQARYEKGKAVRDAANQRYYSYQQAKAAQDAKQRQWEQQFEYNMAKDRANFGLKFREQLRKEGWTEAQIKNMEEKMGLSREKFEFDKDYKTKTHEETVKHHRETERQGNARINISRQNSAGQAAYRKWKMSGGGGSGSNSIEIRGKNGFYRKAGMSSDGVDTFYDQAFEQLSQMKGANGQPIIDMQKVTGSVIPSIFGGNKITKQAKKEAVRNAIYNHPEAGDFIRDIYEFNLDERTPNNGTPYAPAQNIGGGYIAPGNYWTPGGGASPNTANDGSFWDDDDDDDDSFWDD